MNFRRGDVVRVFYPFASGAGGCRRPAPVVQADARNTRIRNAIVAQITTNLRRRQDLAHVPVGPGTPVGPPSGLPHDSLVSCINLATITEDRNSRTVGQLSATRMGRVDDALKLAPGHP